MQAAQQTIEYLRLEGTDLIFVATEALRKRKDMFPYTGPVPILGPRASTVDEQRMDEEIQRRRSELMALEQREALRHAPQNYTAVDIEATDDASHIGGTASDTPPQLSSRQQTILDAIAKIPGEEYVAPVFGRPAMPRIKDVREICGFEVSKEELAAAMRHLEAREA